MGCARLGCRRLKADSGQVDAPASLTVVAGLVPATSIIVALCVNVRGRRDKPGDDAGVSFNAIEIRCSCRAVKKLVRHRH
jgi:hypothetical protein